MEKQSNGKIAIGILVMFVVALSIVGVTYAYFTATFEENTMPASVRVDAGELIANYTHGQSITVNNVVPGWMNDGLHYYDVDVAAADSGHIYATKATKEYADETGSKANGTEGAAMGIASPVSFTVTNNSDAPTGQQAVNYIIRLIVTQNGIYDAWKEATGDKKATLNADRSRLLVYLYKGEYTVGDDLSTPYAGPFVVGDTGVTQILTTVKEGNAAPEVLNATGDSQSYFVVFRYVNDETGVQVTKTTRIQAKVDVIGVSKDINGLTYNDAFTAAEGQTALIPATGLTVADDNGDLANLSETEKALQTALVGTLKTAYGTQNVWYDADNAPVVFAAAGQIVTNPTDKSPKYCTTTQAASDNTCWNTTVE